jgi:hypothetical protein
MYNNLQDLVKDYTTMTIYIQQPCKTTDKVIYFNIIIKFIFTTREYKIRVHIVKYGKGKVKVNLSLCLIS